MIQIKAYFGDWKEVDIKTAKRFLNLLMRPWDKDVFNNHFRGITYEALKNAEVSND
jgi:hypothetical protein